MIPFSPPRIDQKIIDEVVDTLKSGWITTGPKTKLLEKKLAAFCGNEATICLSSATAGLELMLRWYGVTEGDEVILPAYTYSATANVVMHCGAKPVFVDVQDDFNIDPLKVEAAITPRTKVIMPVDFGGWPCDYDALNALVRKPSVKALFKASGENQEMLGRVMVLSDSAHSLGAWYKGNRAGSLTDCSVFSFHAVKNLTTGEGGAIAFNFPPPFDNNSIYSYFCIYTLHGQNKDALSKIKGGNWKYDIIVAGYKANMTDILASIGLVEIDRYEGNLARRRDICKTYEKAFADKPWAIVPSLEIDNLRTQSSFHLFPLRIRGVNEQFRDQLIDQITKSGVSVNVHFMPVPMLSYYKNQGYNIHDYPNTFNLYQNEITLPVFFDLTAEQQEEVINTVITITEQNLSRL
jgi:dTDP-4-amino-4,6-dideoxygalactose transaminase